MKSKILIGLLLLFIGVDFADAGCRGRMQHISPEEFYKKQKEFIISEAGLTQKEAELFFDVYYELQAKKRENQKEISDLMRKARGEELTEKEYDEILTRVYSLKCDNSKLDLDYYRKFTDILPKSKIYKVVRSESKFQRLIIRGMHRKHNRGGRMNRE